ncbi:phage head closure protein [Carnobacteriaceae bacterium zg-ZUI78]|nr:phage head closure protein [Carnobacteriaceae bacterium zg-ZUI78]
MWNDEVILLSSVVYETDDIGQVKTRSQKTPILANKKSVTNAMLFYAAQFGFKPTLVFDIHTYEYNNEPQLMYEGDVYVIRQAYRQNNEITEIQCEKKRGVSDDVS